MTHNSVRLLFGMKKLGQRRKKWDKQHKRKARWRLWTGDKCQTTVGWLPKIMSLNETPDNPFKRLLKEGQMAFANSGSERTQYGRSVIHKWQSKTLGNPESEWTRNKETERSHRYDRMAFGNPDSEHTTQSDCPSCFAMITERTKHGRYEVQNVGWLRGILFETICKTIFSSIVERQISFKKFDFWMNHKQAFYSIQGMRGRWLHWQKILSRLKGMKSKQTKNKNEIRDIQLRLNDFCDQASIRTTKKSRYVVPKMAFWDQALEPDSKSNLIHCMEKMIRLLLEIKRLSEPRGMSAETVTKWHFHSFLRSRACIDQRIKFGQRHKIKQVDLWNSKLENMSKQSFAHPYKFWHPCEFWSSECTPEQNVKNVMSELNFMRPFVHPKACRNECRKSRTKALTWHREFFIRKQLQTMNGPLSVPLCTLHKIS